MCDYDLTGLPETHRCPECGSKYDKDSLIYELRPSSRWWVVVQYAVLLGALHATSNSLSRASFIIVWGLAVTIILLYAVRTRHARNRRGGAVVIGRDGVGIAFHGHMPYMFTWDEIESARRGWVAGEFVLRGRNGRALHRCSAYCFGKTKLVSRCVADINAGRQRFAPRSR